MSSCNGTEIQMLRAEPMAKLANWIVTRKALIVQYNYLIIGDYD